MARSPGNRPPAVPQLPTYPAPILPPAVAQPEVDYMGAFTSALGASRAGVERQFTSALADIAQREGLAQQAVGQLPSQLTNIYQQGDANVMTAAAGLDSAQQASGLTSYLPAGAQMSPLTAARTNDLSSRQADVPLLQLAVQNESNRQRGAVSQAQAASAGESQGQLASFYADMAKMQAQRQYDSADRDVERYTLADERNYADRVRKDEQSFTLRLRDLESTNDIDKITGLSVKEVNNIRRSRDYRAALESTRDTYKEQNRGIFGIGGAVGWKDKSGHKPKQGVALGEELYKKYRYKPQLLKVIATDIPEVAAYMATFGS